MHVSAAVKLIPAPKPRASISAYLVRYRQILMAVIIPRLWNRVRPGTIFAAYLVLYGIGRMWIERLRIDPAHVIAGVRLNDWVFGVVVILALIYLIVSLRRRTPTPA